MKKLFTFLTLILLFCTPLSAENTTLPYVNFNVVANLDVEANMINVELTVKKEAGIYAVANSECNKTLNKISELLKQDGIDKNNFKIYNFNSYSEQGFWGKNYVVIGYVKIKLTDLATALNTMESICFLDESFSNLDDANPQHNLFLSKSMAELTPINQIPIKKLSLQMNVKYKIIE